MTQNCNADVIAINTIRTLSIDAIEKANSGHPGLPMGAAPMSYVLWNRFLNVDPKNPQWPNRDRFILSAGHGSMLIYSLLHLAGYDLPMEEIKNFRQWGSKTPGHPEFGHTVGVETTTGPLGQGTANAVGMAIAERMLAGKFNKDGFNIVDHYTYVLAGDGCLMEGISGEAASLAGHLKLGKLIMLYDSNDISLDGPTSISFTENVAMRYESFGWQVITVEDGDNDVASIEKAIAKAKAETEKPSLLIIKTTIGFGSPNKQGSSGAHGAPLGKEEIKLTKKNLNWNYEEDFFVPEEAKSKFSEIEKRGSVLRNSWNETMSKYKEAYPELYKQFYQFLTLEINADLDTVLPTFKTGENIASRSSSHKVMNALPEAADWFIGGDADLSCSTQTFLKGLGDFTAENPTGKNIRFGVREHAMAAIANGIAFHGGLKPFTGTFFSFVDYMRPSIRLAALCKIPVVFIFTHDSVAVGEDGPTHQPIEQLMSIRSMPGLIVLRPADANEVREAWKFIATYNDGPIVLVLSRQNIPTIDRTVYKSERSLKMGGYVLADSQMPQAIIIGTGAETGLALKAYEELKAEGIKTRVVSMPSWELFDKQSREYKEAVLPPDLDCRVSIEAGSTFGWMKYTGPYSINIGVDHFGTSAPGNTVLERFGITVENVKKSVKELLSNR
ncbi:MAG: transketolase [Candidatus Delongbacteria bacterium]|nr:transketolase [Candidatus Delongbacteria bacterium]MBN2834542.1 transketolase [Candidatus Delongbacteria bacterium]